MTDWTPVIGEMLRVHSEDVNTHDRYAVASSRNESVVGHLPNEFSRQSWHFLQHGGRIFCEATGRRKRSTALLKGLVVPCTYHFWASQR